MTAARKPRRGRLRQFAQSLAAKIVVLTLVFFAVPVLMYEQLRQADEEKRGLLLQSLENQGRVVAASLRDDLEATDARSLRQLADQLANLGTPEDLKLKLLLRPEGQAGGEGFYYIGSSPPLPNLYLQEERQDLLEAGVLERLPESCEGMQPLAVRYVNPAGEEEVLSSITPIRSPLGCWAVITSHDTGEAIGSALGRPYWQTPEVQVAAVIYIVMALLVISMLLGLRFSLQRFARAARKIRMRGVGDSATSFADANHVPELNGVADEFDRMVDTLRASAWDIRHAAEDNAHAFKTPIATIAQSVEPLRRALNPTQTRALRALELIDRSLERLDALVAASRRMDEATAEVMEAATHPIDLSRMVNEMLRGYSERFAHKNLRVARGIEENLKISAGEEIVETVLENLFDNAIDFSPEDGTLSVTLLREGKEVLLTVSDEGPGVPEDRIDKIFERYASYRPEAVNRAAGQQNFGIGLWIVRRNVESLGGKVTASNRSPHGLEMTVRLPLLSA